MNGYILLEIVILVYSIVLGIMHAVGINIEGISVAAWFYKYKADDENALALYHKIMLKRCIIVAVIDVFALGIVLLGYWQISLSVIFVGVMVAAIMGIKDRDKF